jgi:hypothetical protein
MARTSLGGLLNRNISKWYTTEIPALQNAIESTYRTRTEVVMWDVAGGNVWCQDGGGTPSNVVTDIDFGANATLLCNGVMQTPGALATVDLFAGPNLVAPVGPGPSACGMIFFADSHVVTNTTTDLAFGPTGLTGTTDTNVTIVLIEIAAAPGVLGILGIAGPVGPGPGVGTGARLTGEQVASAIAGLQGTAFDTTGAQWTIVGTFAHNCTVTATTWTHTNFRANFNNNRDNS